MKIAYDKAADALYIRLQEGVDQCRVVRLSEDIAVDFGAEDTPVGIEILRASRLFDRPDSPSVELQDVAPKVAS
ncbi:MAG: DUF2283 domain-containing protein [Gemmatimonadota bacterium]